MGYWGCGMLEMWDVGDVRCWGCGIIGMWDGRYVGCLGCRMFGMWNDPDVGCLPGCGIVIYIIWHYFNVKISLKLL